MGEWEGKIKTTPMKKEDLICYRCIYSDPGDMTIEEALETRTAYPIPCLRYALLACSDARTLPWRKCGEGKWREKRESNRDSFYWKEYKYRDLDLEESGNEQGI